MLLSVSGVAKGFSSDQILRGIDFRISAREKVALVGRNGTGKTTLLKIITGQLAPDAGSVSLAQGAKVGYLRQEAPLTAGLSVLEEAEQAVREQMNMRRRLEELENRLQQDPSDADLEEYALLHEHFLEAEGYSAERDLRVVLQRMGFTEDEFDKPSGKLSGGEKTRLAIARLLLEEPDLLILDEPTNHLDLQATEWLEGWIRAYHGAILLVSHDRAFLDNTAERVLEIEEGRVKAYPGPFPKYLQLRQAERARQGEVARRQDIEIAKMDEYVRRFMNSQRTAQAKGRQKLMNRLIESKVSAPTSAKGMQAGFGKASRSGEIVVETEKLSVGYGGQPLFTGLDWTARWGDRWGVIGENGSGKSTLVKVFLGLLDPLSGKAKLGSGVVAGYFSQDTSDLDPEASPLDSLVYDTGLSPAEGRNLLGRFLISGDDVYRPVKTLSGGEKNKLSLARLTQLNPNLLVLDEPTNHLDMDSREALAQVLNEYQGTLILVSHDRWLLGQVTKQTLDIRRVGPIVYPGSYDEYRRRSLRPSAKPEPVSAKMAEPEVGSQRTPRETSKEIERLKKLVGEIEANIASHEAELGSIEAQLADLAPAADILFLTKRHRDLQEMVAGTMASWEEQSLKLQGLQASQG